MNRDRMATGIHITPPLPARPDPPLGNIGMPRWRHRFWPWPALAGLAFCVLFQAGHASAAIPDTAAFLAQTEQVRTKDHPRFLRMLEQIHRDAPPLSQAEQWHLRYLDAWQTAFQGDYVKADAQLRDVIDHSGNVTLVAKASALLLSNLGINRRYSETFVLANRLVTDLPGIKDRLARFLVLFNLSQAMMLANQNDLAIKYARMMEDTLPAGETLCIPLSLQVAALNASALLTASSPQLRRAIDTCVAARQPVFANTLWLLLADLYLGEGRPDETIALLNRIAPSIKANQYYPHMESSESTRARTLWTLGDATKAEKAAIATVAMSYKGEISLELMDAYDVLYQIENKRGNAAAALSYFKHYATHDKGYLDDASARALAYQTVQQHVLAGKLETQELSKQNTTLRLQQALDAKAVETGRLYIFLLLMIVASIAFWLYRLKRSQLRFMRLSHHDGLTGVFNHQHFINEAERVLHVLERKADDACLVSIDLDHFKQVNDTHGHAMGDAVLRHTVTVCQQQLHPADLFGRMGGEEFGILLYECSRAQGMDIANRIRMAIGATPMENEGYAISIFASVGLACTDVSGYELQGLCREADAALYRAKRAGRNRVIADTETETETVTEPDTDSLVEA